MMKGKISVIIAVAILVAISAVGITVGVKMKKDTDAPQQNQTEQNKPGNKEVVSGDGSSEQSADISEIEKADIIEKRPAFIYFVAETDENYNEAMKVFEELKAEYSDKVDFELKNVTQDPSILENFALVKGQTPALIMDGKEGITGFHFKMTDKGVLEKEIEKTL